jgi:hypothetical protein
VLYFSYWSPNVIVIHCDPILSVQHSFCMLFSPKVHVVLVSSFRVLNRDSSLNVFHCCVGVSVGGGTYDFKAPFLSFV